MKKKLEFTTSSPAHKIKKFQHYESELPNLAQQNSSDGDINIKPINKAASLHKAARNGRLETVKRLVAEGVDLESKTSWGATALYIAATKKHFDITKFLIESGADVNAKTTLNDTSLNAAMGFVDTKIAILLIESGANVEEAILSGDRPLHTAAKYGNAVLVEILLIHGAKIEAKSGEGLSALSIAISHMSSEVVKVLAWYGANITHSNMYDAIVTHAVYDENSIADVLRLATTFDSLCDKEMPTEVSGMSLYDIFKGLNQLETDLLFNRLLYKPFRDKELSLEEIKQITTNLISNLDYIITEPNIDLFCKLRSFLNEFNRDIVASSLQSEVGSVSSLFKLAVNALKAGGLWNQEVMQNSHPDIADKAQTLERIEDFLQTMHLTLKPENSSLVAPDYTGNGSDEDNLPVTGDFMANNSWDSA